MAEKHAEISVSAVIPAYNEAEAIAGVVEDVHKELSRRKVPFEIVVVDDGSRDGTADAVDAKLARVIRHPANGGYGKSLQTGIEAAKHEWILMLDADGSYPASEAARLLDFAPGFDLIVGSRQGTHFWGGPWKTLMRLIYLRFASFVVGQRVPDANSGLRLVRRELVDHFGLVECLGYSFTTTMTLSLLKEGRFVRFEPIRFDARAGGRSKVKPVRDVLRTLQLMTEVILIYNPLKLFAALTALLVLVAAALAGGYLATDEGAWLIASAIAGFSALFCFWGGCVLDTVRMHGRRP